MSYIVTEGHRGEPLLSRLALYRQNSKWQQAAVCRQADPELFFPIGSAGTAAAEIQRAKAICASCPVRRPCLTYALATSQESGSALVFMSAAAMKDPPEGPSVAGAWPHHRVVWPDRGARRPGSGGRAPGWPPGPQATLFRQLRIRWPGRWRLSRVSQAENTKLAEIARHLAGTGALPGVSSPASKP